jgi:hypothetical protein
VIVPDGSNELSVNGSVESKTNSFRADRACLDG